MKVFGTKAAAMFGASLLAILGASEASAQATAYYTIENQFGSSISLDSASCTSSGSIFPPFSIASGSTVSFKGMTSGPNMLCTVRYHNGIYGCQFQISASNTGGLFASAGGYKGSGTSPTCRVLGENSAGDGWSGTFRMSR